MCIQTERIIIYPFSLQNQIQITGGEVTETASICLSRGKILINLLDKYNCLSYANYEYLACFITS